MRKYSRVETVGRITLSVKDYRTDDVLEPVAPKNEKQCDTMNSEFFIVLYCNKCCRINQFHGIVLCFSCRNHCSSVVLN